MRVRRSILVLSLTIATAMVGTMAMAHNSEEEGKYSGVNSTQSTELQSVMGGASCVDGMAGEFPCDGIDLMSFIPHGALGTTFANDMWGWTDPQTGRDYALMGAGEGTVFVDITAPESPAVLGILPTHTSDNFFWRDIKVYADHAFIVSEDNGHGMQVFDLTQLRDWDGTYTEYSETAHYAGISSAHNLNINEDTGFAYAVGVREKGSCSGGLHMINISDPTNPTFAGCWGGDGYIHDTQCVIYEGPDADYQGREICFNSNAPSRGPASLNRVSITDVTDKSNPVRLSAMTYSNSGHSHQGWLTPDQQYFLHGDELDELLHGLNTTTRVWDVRDLDNPTLIGVFANDTTSIDHNIYTEGSVAFASNYTSGLRVYDTSDVSAGQLSELAFFDVYPENDDRSFEGGSWSNYPYFSQDDIVAATGMDRGLFVLRYPGGVNN